MARYSPVEVIWQRVITSVFNNNIRSVDAKQPVAGPARPALPTSEVDITSLDTARQLMFGTKSGQTSNPTTKGQRFGAPREWDKQGNVTRTHKGTDFPVKTSNIPIYPLWSGTVVAIGSDPSSTGGLYVTVSSTRGEVERQTSYAHMSKISASLGQIVYRGITELGITGATGNVQLSSSVGVLHLGIKERVGTGAWEVRDPEKVLSGVQATTSEPQALLPEVTNHQQIAGALKAYKERILLMNKKLSEAEASRIATQLLNAAANREMNARLLFALITIESRFNPRVVSKAGAKGLCQLMDGTARGLKVTDSFNIEQNISGGATYLMQKINKYRDIALGLAAYNGGDGAIDKDKNGNYVIKTRSTEEYARKVLKEYYALSGRDSNGNIRQ